MLRLSPWLALILLVHPVVAQSARAARLDGVDARARAERLALTGDLGLPALPPVRADSPRDQLRFADRRPVGQGPPPAGYSGSAVLVDAVIPKGEGGTGTDKVEVIQYQLPQGYDPDGAPVPLLVAYHGFGASAKSVALQSTLDEEAYLRGWAYLSVTGLDDQLFGSPISQQHTEVAIQWMLDGFHVDPERVCMVGFSMGAGVAMNFAARHRDPEGVMIAGLGLVSGVSDWTATWKTGSPPTKAVLEGPFNFGGTPNEQPFAYQRSSGLHFAPDSYPPLPGELDQRLSMVSNLAGLPVHVTWDQADSLPLVQPQNHELVRWLAQLGCPLDVAEQFGTVDPDTGFFAPHSWAVLDEVRLFAQLDGARALRRPAVFDAQLDRDTAVSSLQVIQAQAGAFSWLSARLEPGVQLGVQPGAPVSVDAIENVRVLQLDAAAAGLSAQSGFASGSADALGHEFGVVGLQQTPSWVVHATTGAFLPEHEPDPVTSGVRVSVPAGRHLPWQLVVDPSWRASLHTTPDPVAIMQPVSLLLDGPPTSTHALLVFAGTQALFDMPSGHVLGVLPAPPAHAYLLPLDEGDLALPFDVPTDTQLFGVEIALQAVLLDSEFEVDVLSNVWVAHLLPQGG